MQTLKEHLASLGLLGKEVPESILDAAKEAYYKEYHRQYYESYKHKRLRVELRFTKSEYAAIKASARQHKKRISNHLKKCALAYINTDYIVPDEKMLNDLKLQIRAIGNNINQIAYQANATNGEVVDVNSLFRRLDELEQLVEAKLTTPVLIEDLLKNTALIARLTKGQTQDILNQKNNN